MDTISPALADAFSLLRDDLYRHLDEAECLGQCSSCSEADEDAAHKLIGDLVVVIRGLLVEHQEQAGGRCRVCPSTWPCPVVRTIHGLVKDPRRQFAALLRWANGDD